MKTASKNGKAKKCSEGRSEKRQEGKVASFTTRRSTQRPPKKLKSKTSDSPTDRTIRDDENLSTEDFMSRLRISYPTFRDMLDAGLPVRTIGKYRRISGREFNRWAETCPLLRPDKSTTKA